MPSAGNIPKADSDGNGEVGDVEGYAYLFGTLPAYAVENVAYGFISMICVMPIIIKISFSILIGIIQIFAIISKKNRRIGEIFNEKEKYYIWIYRISNTIYSIFYK